MLKIRIIPCLLLQGRKLVKTIKFSNPNYIGDPINAVKIFNELSVDEIMLFDIDATKKNQTPNFVLIQEIAAESFIPFCYGGGITSLTQVQQLIKIGIEKISINTLALSAPAEVKKIISSIGSQSVVGALDFDKDGLGRYKTFVGGGKRKTRFSPVEHACYLEDLGVGELFVNSMTNDGSMQGYDIEQLEKIAASVRVPVVALGGAGSLQDMQAVVAKTAVAAVAAGSLFVYKGRHKAVLINYPEYKLINSLFG